MLVHIKDLIKEAEKGGYAIGAFNFHNLESILGVAQAALECKSPAIIQVSEGAIKYMGLKPVTHLVATVAKNVAYKVPIALHLDHGNSFDSVIQCIEAGFTSVHIDASQLPLDENIKISKQVVDFAHPKGVWVQGEVGPIMGGHGQEGGKLDQIPIADPDEVEQFVKRTKVDTLAAAIGTAHGVYENESVDLELLEDIKERTNKPFVMHGGSGIEGNVVRSAIKKGVNVINIGTDIKVSFSKTLIKTCKNNPQERDPRNLMKPSIEAVKKVVMAKMDLFGSSGRCASLDVRT